MPWYFPKEYLNYYPEVDIKIPPILENDTIDLSEMGKPFATRKNQGLFYD